MKLLRLFSAMAFIVAFASLQVFAQQRQGTSPPAASPTPAKTGVASANPAKVALITTALFRDEKAGILRWVAANKRLQLEVAPKEKELVDLETRIVAINKELETLSKSQVVDRKSIESKQDDIARLQREQKFKKEEGEALLKKRYAEVVGPISADIVKAMEAFAKQRGITLLLDYGRLLEVGAVAFADESADLTLAFIAEYNSKNPVTASTAGPGR